ncbi:MAG: hypothetical protein GY749_09675 [Desulfobacteraceae bacterium]|nr:hypothetical protein [Desulfobacteraceae bacterium]
MKSATQILLNGIQHYLCSTTKDEDKQVSYYGEIFDKESFKGAFNIADSCHIVGRIKDGTKCIYYE